MTGVQTCALPISWYFTGNAKYARRAEPDPGVQFGAPGVLRVAGEVPREREVVDRGPRMVPFRVVTDLVNVRVALPVALHVRAGRGGAGPPVRRLAVVVVPVAAGGWSLLVDDRPGPGREIRVRGLRQPGQVGAQRAAAAALGEGVPDGDQAGAVDDDGRRRLRGDG